MNYSFICPSCGQDTIIEEVLINAVVSNELDGIEPDGTDEPHISVAQTTVHDGETDRFQCFLCGHAICYERSELLHFVTLAESEK